jgi:hypothetical protein
MGEPILSKETLESVISKLLDEKLQPFTDKLDNVTKEIGELRSSMEFIDSQFDT